MPDFLEKLIHIDQTLGFLLTQYNELVYLILFLIVFAETGFIVLPFLPGDSLLFIAGAFSASGQVDLLIVSILFILAAFLGNTLNYLIGRYIGPKIFFKKSIFFNHDGLLKTQKFYKKHGGKTIVLARFLPILRTFAPFIAGVASMSIVRFQMFNFLSALFWVSIVVGAGYFFGNMPFAEEYINVIILVGSLAAVIPIFLIAIWKLFQYIKRK